MVGGPLGDADGEQLSDTEHEIVNGIFRGTFDMLLTAYAEERAYGDERMIDIRNSFMHLQKVPS